MLHETTISRTRGLDTPLDRRHLYDLGLQHIRDLAAATWTDHNVHDPGITILELLSYALTDLGYRATFPIEDVLAAAEDNAASMARQFFTARTILTNRPFTPLDHRKRLIDLPDVKNAWLLPASLTLYADTTRGVLFGPATLHADQITDVAALVIRLRDATDAFAAHLIRRFSDHARARITEVDPSADEPGVRALLLAELNRVILGPALHEPGALGSVTLSEATRALLATAPNGEALARLHRHLLEDALPGLIAIDATLRARGSAPGVTPVVIAGLWDVRIEFMDAVTTATRRATALKTVRECLLANRTLGEDFASIAEIETQDFLLCGELELAPDADPVEIHARAFHGVQEYLAPTIQARRLEELLRPTRPGARAHTVDEAFEGPALDHGLLSDDDLTRAELRTVIRLSDVISIITDIEGVVAVRALVVNPAGATEVPDTWQVPVAAGRKARLDTTRSRLVCTKRHVPVPVRPEAWQQRFEELRRDLRERAESLPPEDVAIPLGRHRSPADYTSFQNHFPALYGIGPDGVSTTANGLPRATALARQLKGYLLFFDQVMADFLAQLAHVADLFSTDPTVDRTIFRQPVTTFREHELIYRDALDGAGFAARPAFQETPEDFARRRNRFLDHLLARHAEGFADYANITRSVFGTGDQALIQTKCEFLRELPTVGSERALAYNHTLKTPADVWNSDNISGLEKRLARLLGFRNRRRRNLSEIAFDIYAEIDATPDDEFRWRILHHETHEILLSSSTRYATRTAARAEMITAIQRGMVAAGYEREVASNGTHFFNILDESGEIVGRRITYFDTPEAMEAAIAALIDYLGQRYSDDGMFVIEMLLLRPEHSADPFLPVCVDPACISCSDLDPYSHRLHIILPAFSSRFSNMDFRRFVEETIRAEVPAHLLPRICWISRDDMAALEKAYREWLMVKSGASRADRSARLGALVATLQSVRNVYPPAVLRACDSTTSEDRFILGRTALGSLSGESPQPPPP